VLPTIGADLDVDSPSFTLLLKWLGGGHGTRPHEQTVLSMISTVVSSARPSVGSTDSVEDVTHRFAGFARAASSLKSIKPDEVTNFFQTISAPLAEWPQETRASLLVLLGKIGDIAPEAASPELTRLVSEYFGSDPDSATRLALEEAEQLPESLKSAIAPHLRALMSGAEEAPRLPAANALVAMDPNDDTGALKAGVLDCIGRSLYVAAAKNIKAHATQLDPHVPEFAERVIQLAEGMTDPKTAGRALGFFLTTINQLGDEQLDGMRDVMIAFIQRGDPEFADEALKAADKAADGRFGTRIDEVVSAAFAYVKSASPPPSVVVAFVAEHLGGLQRIEQGAFVSHLATMVRDPEQRAPALEGVRALSNAPSRERQELVTALVHAEVMETEPGARVDLLRLA
jgi:hypothetical protein